LPLDLISWLSLASASVQHLDKIVKFGRGLLDQQRPNKELQELKDLLDEFEKDLDQLKENLDATAQTAQTLATDLKRLKYVARGAAILGAVSFTYVVLHLSGIVH
jgi:Skp family chaperone for outer membrane proteins